MKVALMIKIREGFVWPPYSAWVPKRDLIIIAQERFGRNERLIAHELQHVKQHRKYGPFFYPIYALGFIRAGFSYYDNWMERQARGAESDPQMLAWAREVIKDNQK